MSCLIGGFSCDQYAAYLNQTLGQKQNWSFGRLIRPLDLIHAAYLNVLINRVTYFLLHGYAIYPNNAYLFQKFKSHEFSQIETKVQLQAAQEIFALFQECPECDQTELQAIKLELEAIERRLEEPVSDDEILDEGNQASNKQSIVIYEDRSQIEIPENHIVYCDQPEKVGFIEKSTYQNAVHQLPIACVDIFLYNSKLDAYLLVFRKNAPAKDTWWIPGGRLYKGESFFEAAIRKCREEINVKVRPIKQLGTYSTLFPDSEWECQTHTINTIVLAILSSDEKPEVNFDHADYQWRSLKHSPDAEDRYLNQAYQEALPYLETR